MIQQAYAHYLCAINLDTSKVHYEYFINLFIYIAPVKLFHFIKVHGNKYFQTFKTVVLYF